MTGRAAAQLAARAGPRSLPELFWAFSWLSLQGFGGVLAVVQRELVEKRGWLGNEEFVEDWAVAQVMPGPNVCNLALMFGDRHFGWRGAATALAGLLALPLVLLLSAATLYGQLAGHAAAVGALRGMGAVAAGLIGGTSLKLLAQLRRHPLGLALVVAVATGAFAALVLLHLPLVAVVLGLGGVACALTWRRLRRGEAS
ncbi:chromate transporter [Azohydromonas caseinilytica]|uniref:Chromate transporter n=1 Tax=Azohydromonas caseinilytica TaxID=2728836 RepID=A0A848FFV6_9BURK|nr:chromate transporter [Azohydromonas caseinilytica]NML18254.1 chromate transporter [Azohydromonas caseinilytica]